MMDDPALGKLRNRVWRLYDYIQDNLYLNRTDIEVHDKKINAALFLSMATALVQGKALIIGEPGLGKTTTAEWVSALFYRIPLGTIWRGTVSGHPEQTEEKIIGRPDLGHLNQGEEVVHWSYFTLLPVKIVDEINRLPETKQSLILDGVDRGKWEYLNDAVINDMFCFFATANYAGQGTHTLVSPLMDRFDIVFESKHPGANLAFRIGAAENHTGLFRNPGIEKDFHSLLDRKMPQEQRMAELSSLCDRYGRILDDDLQVKTLSMKDLEQVAGHCATIAFDVDANAFLRMILSEFSFCYPFGQKRFNQVCEEGCHYSQYLCHDVKSCISNRFSMSIRRYSQILAWLFSENVVTIEHVKTIAPYALAHRTTWNEPAVAKRDQDRRNDPMILHMAKKAVDLVHSRYLEQSQLIKDALSAAHRISMGEKAEPVKGDHPLYRDILRDLDLS